MKEEQFLNNNITKWQRMEQYNKKLQNKNLSSMSREEIREYTELYRLIGHQLAYARTHYKDSKTVEYLNQIVGVSHNYFYVRERSSLSEMVYYFTTGFPKKVRQNRKFLYLSTGAFFFGAILLYVLTMITPEYIHYFFPPEIVANMDMETSSRGGSYPVFSAMIMTNNIKVCFLNFVWGFFAGIGTLYVLVFNGALLGSLSGYVGATASTQLHYWALILPHGFLELTAIFISGAAGLTIGKHMLIPGNMTRYSSVIKGAKEAAILIPGVVVMLIIAGIIEGFITPLPISSEIKLAFAAMTLIIIIIYFVFCGRSKSE